MPILLGSALLTTISFFYIYTAASYLEATVNHLQNRVIYLITFQSYIINESIDHVIIASATVSWLVLSLKGKERPLALAFYGGFTVIAITIWSISDALLDVVALLSVPIIISLLIYGWLSSKRNIANFDGALTADLFALFGIALGLVAIINLAMAVIFSDAVDSLPVGNYVYQILTLLSSSFSAVLLVVLIFCIPVKLLINELVPRIATLSSKIDHIQVGSTQSVRLATKIISLVLAMLMCVALVLIPHQPSINKDSQLVGVDTPYYVDWINTLTQQSTRAFELIQQSFLINDGDRPLTLLFFYLMVHAVDAHPSVTIELVPLILGPALVLASYFLTREITLGNELASIVAAFLTSVSVHTLVGIYAGFYANWLAIAIGYFSLVFLFRFLRTPGKMYLTAYAASLVAVLLTHVYTWNIFTLVTGIFLVVALKFKMYPKKSIISLLLVLLCCLLIDVTRATITSTPLAMQHILLAASVEGGGSALGLLDNFALRWDNIVATQTGYAGLFSSFAILALGAIWLFISSLRQQSTIFLLIFLSIGILPLFLGNWLIQTRVFYNIPFEVPAALALTYILRHYAREPAFIAVCIWLVAISIRSVSHFYYVAPS